MILSFVRYLGKSHSLQAATGNNQFSIIVTAYKDLSVAQPLINALGRQDYQHFGVLMVADCCQGQSLMLPENSSNIKVLYPEVELHSKVKSFQVAMEHVNDAADFVLVFDPDNVVRHDFLWRLNDFHNRGYAAVQCKRVAKNLNTTVACTDAAGEMYKNFIEREVNFAFGSSATISGSGMSIRTDLFRQFLYSSFIQRRVGGVILGEDKHLQNFIVRSDVQIAFDDHNLVYDEKITSSDQVRKQRTRWINAYLQNVASAFQLLWKGLLSLRWNMIFFSVVSLYPPLFMLVLFAGLLALANLVLFGIDQIVLIPVVGCFVFVINFILVLLFKKADRKILSAIFYVPVFIFNQLLALFQLRKSKHDFLVTEKTTHLEVEEINSRK
jgi:cellulose synthase/poly-beta-1,6-N-acetylglucosamine synthase-like glycosyltransferase